MRALHTRQCEIQRPIPRDLSFRNPLAFRLTPSHRTWEPIPQLECCLAQRAFLQPGYQVQYRPARSAPEAVEQIPLQFHVKGILSFALVDRASPPKPAPLPAQPLDPVMLQHRLHRHSPFDGGKAYEFPPHAAASASFSTLRL
jgi:hypothetical protein